jgi:dTDP-4-amino-4,6-dideoxygalactose transaminase
MTIDPAALGITREELRETLSRRGIETAVHYPLPLHRQPIFRGYGCDRDFPVSTHLAESVVSLPVHPGLSNGDLDQIVRAVRELADRERHS